MVANKVARLTALLTLTTTQQAEATTIFTTEQSSLAAIAPAMKTARTALKTAVQSNELSAITTESSQIGALTGQETLAESTANAQFYATLTTEQQTKYNKFGGGRGGRGGFGPQARRH
jgi:Spy/CpxP family protein refolding chaperone